MIEPAANPVYVFEGFRLDTQRRVLFGPDGQAISLTPRVFDALLHFVERSGQLLTKDQLLRDLWPNVIVEEHNLNKTVSELRRVLGENPGEHKFIVTKPGRGYRFVADVAVESTREADGEVRGADANPPRRERDLHYWAAAAVGAVALAGFVAVFGFLRSAPERALSPPTPVSLEKGGQGRAVWSPDGKSIAYPASERAGAPFRLFVRDLDSAVARPITGELTNPSVRQWTTTGRIVYRDGPHLWSVSPVGAMPEIIAGIDLSGPGALAVTRDGTTLALVRPGEDGAWGVWSTPLSTIDLQKYEATPLEMAGQVLGGAGLEFSPDGRQLLLKWLGPPEQIWVLPFPPDATRRPRRVLEELPPILNNGFSWLPDSRHVVVATAEGTNPPQLHIADTRSGAFRSFTNDPADKAAPSVSPDGDRLVYIEAVADFDIVTLTIGTAALRPLIVTENREEQARWAANVPTMTYLTTRRGPYELWLHQAGQVDKPLVAANDLTKQWLFAPEPSPDGARVIYQLVDKDSGASHLWMLSLAGGSPERVTTSTNERAGSWSPDGAWYVFWVRDPDGSDTLKKVRTTGRASPETLLGGAVPSRILPIWSRDGAWILIADRGLKLVSPDGETIRDLGIENSPCGFARAEMLLYCLRAPQPDGRRTLVTLDFDGNVIKIIGSVPADRGPRSSAGPFAPSETLSLTPDGSGVTYSVVNSSNSLWLLEDISQVPLP